jgi:type I restriction enzyme M protein
MRSDWLVSQGFSILRFWNNDVMENMEGVLQRIIEALSRQASVAWTPHPDPNPQGGGEP